MSEAAQGSAKERADLVWDFWCKTSGAVISSRCAHRCAHCWERKHHQQKHKRIVISGLSGAGKQERFWEKPLVVLQIVLWNWDIASKAWWPNPAWLSPLCLPPDTTWAAPWSAVTPLLSAVCWDHTDTLLVMQNELWSTSCVWFAPTSTPTWEQLAKEKTNKKDKQ